MQILLQDQRPYKLYMKDMVDMEDMEDMEARVRAIHDALVDTYGEPAPPREKPPLASLLQTILSQHTTDANRDAAWKDLTAEFGTDYEAIHKADPDTLAGTIRTAGLANQKAARFQDALDAIVDQTDGEYTLSFLDPMSVEEALSWLTDIRGIGPKTAGIVLLFDFGKPYFPVDTHCERLAKRFELIPEDASYDQAHDLLTEGVPDELHYSFHRLLIDHGRAVCTARNAHCEDSPVCREFCHCEHCE